MINLENALYIHTRFLWQRMQWLLIAYFSHGPKDALRGSTRKCSSLHLNRSMCIKITLLEVGLG